MRTNVQNGCAAYLADGDKAVQNRLNITAVRHLIRTKTVAFGERYCTPFSSRTQW